MNRQDKKRMRIILPAVIILAALFAIGFATVPNHGAMPTSGMAGVNSLPPSPPPPPSSAAPMPPTKGPVR